VPKETAVGAAGRAGLPEPRGPLTEQLFALLRQDPDRCRHRRPGLVVVDGAAEDDPQLALYACYELHYLGFPEADAAWEWHPGVLEVRRRLEARAEEELHARVGPVHSTPGEAIHDLWDLARGGDGPSLSAWLEQHGTMEHARELAVHRSAYQLKEADPHTWGIPRLRGRAKAAMVAIQADEYGLGDPAEGHATLFARTMEALQLDPTPNHYLDELPSEPLWATNVISLFGLHRRLRGALVGHLALFEMTSVGPMARYDRAMGRLGVAAAGRRFYRAHVEADRLHQHLATDGMVAGLLAEEPELASDVVFGARALTTVETGFSAHVLGRWAGGRCSLRGGSAPGHVLPGHVLVPAGLPG